MAPTQLGERLSFQYLPTASSIPISRTCLVNRWRQLRDFYFQFLTGVNNAP
jgi:hypothetical protein